MITSIVKDYLQEVDKVENAPEMVKHILQVAGNHFDLQEMNYYES